MNHKKRILSFLLAVIVDIGDVLETNPDFPNSEDEAWENEGRDPVFLDEEGSPIMIIFDNGVGLTLDIGVTPSGDNYVYLSENEETYENEYRMTFNMTDGVLTSITFEDLSDEDLFESYEGTYAPARESVGGNVLPDPIEVVGDKFMSGDTEVEVKDAEGNPIPAEKREEAADAINGLLTNEAFSSFDETRLEEATEDSDDAIIAALKAKAEEIIKWIDEDNLPDEECE